MRNDTEIAESLIRLAREICSEDSAGATVKALSDKAGDSIEQKENKAYANVKDLREAIEVEIIDEIVALGTKVTKQEDIASALNDLEESSTLLKEALKRMSEAREKVQHAVTSLRRGCAKV